MAKYAGSARSERSQGYRGSTTETETLDEFRYPSAKQSLKPRDLSEMNEWGRRHASRRIHLTKKQADYLCHAINPKLKVKKASGHGGSTLVALQAAIARVSFSSRPIG